MKKKYICLFVFIMMFLIGNCKVLAATELYCEYQILDNNRQQIIFEQFSDGTQKLTYSKNNGKTLIENISDYNLYEINDDGTAYVQVNELAECKEAVEYTLELYKKNRTYWFFDTSDIGYDDFTTRINEISTLTKAGSDKGNVQNMEITFCSGVDWDKQLSNIQAAEVNNDWISICLYKYETPNDCKILALMYNQTTYKINDISYNNDRCQGTTNCSVDYSSLDNFYERYFGHCPGNFYVGNKEYTGGPNSLGATTYTYSPLKADTSGIIYAYDSALKITPDDIVVIGNEITIESCEDLLSPAIVEKINEYLKWIRIIVPILLIILGIMDFGQAILASDEDKMKKAQKKFFLRLIIAVVIFFIPTFINLLFNIANEVWDVTKPGSCGIR